MKKLPITAVVVSCNEGNLLGKCLESLIFCEKIIVVDLESTDSTESVAKMKNVEYIFHHKVPAVEIIHTWIQDKLDTDWLLISDPDEVCPPMLADDIRSFMKQPPDNIGAVYVPWRFYFGKKPLTGTQWGGIQRRLFLINLRRFYFTEHVHRGRHLKNGYKSFNIKHNGDNCLNHFWMQNLAQLINKHKRYLKQEGKSQYGSGLRTNIKKVLFLPFSSFFNSFVLNNGYKDGFTGLFLSFFWAWYATASQIELWKYQHKLNKNGQENTGP